MKGGTIKFTELADEIFFEIEVEIPRSPVLNKAISGDSWRFYESGKLSFTEKPTTSEKYRAAFKEISKRFAEWVPYLEKAVDYEKTLEKLKSIPTEELMKEISRRTEEK